MSSSSSSSKGGKSKGKGGNGKKIEKDIEAFLKETLPSLKKEMHKRKREPFKLSEYADYFKEKSKVIPTFLLPLFNFVQKTEVVCTRYGCFSGKHMVKCAEGFNRVMILSKYADPEQFTPDVQKYCTQRFGKVWFKIPPKDGYRAKAASAAGHDGMFKVILIGVTFDSFLDKETNEEVKTINPNLLFEACLPPNKSVSSASQQNVDESAEPAKKKRKRSSKKKSKKEDEEEEEGGDDNEDVDNEKQEEAVAAAAEDEKDENSGDSGVDVGAQGVALSLLPE